MKIRHVLYLLLGTVWCACGDESSERETSVVQISIGEPTAYQSRAVTEKTAWQSGDQVLLLVQFGNNRRRWVDSTYVTAIYNGGSWDFSREVTWHEHYYFMQVKGYYVQGQALNVMTHNFPSTGLEDVLYVESDTVEVSHVDLSAWQHKRSRVRVHVQTIATGAAVAGATVQLSNVDYFSQYGANLITQQWGALTATTDADGDATFFCSSYANMDMEVSVNGVTKTFRSPFDSVNGESYHIIYYQ